MASNLLVPFDNRPSSVAVKTASYTIPAGKYARVVVEVDSGGIFTIGGVSAVTSAPFVNIDAQGVVGSASYTVPVGYRARATGHSTSAATSFQVNGNQAIPLAINVNSTEFSVGPGGSYTTNGNAGTVNLQGIAEPSNATYRQADFWLPTGTVISGSGNWRAVVMEYNEIT